VLPFFSVELLFIHFAVCLCVGLVALLLFLFWLRVVAKKANVPPID
jgi:hypothetical protein